MNVIVVMLDSFRFDHVAALHGGKGAFGDVPPCRTPGIDKFAEEAVVFEQFYPEGLPTIPVRTALMTGNYTLTTRPWQALSATDVSIAEILRREGYNCGLITDCYHYRAPGMNFHRGFHFYHWVRGQEYDPATSHDTQRNLDDFVNEHYDDAWRGRVNRFLANTDGFSQLEDYFPGQVFSAAIDWLAKNRGRKNFLWIDSFDPHEPWIPPKRFDEYTDPGYKGPRIIMPLGEPVDEWAAPETVRYTRGLYAGEAAFVDYWFGQLIEALGDRGYLDDTLIVLTADHGHPLADHGKFLKGQSRLYSELLKILFMVRLPGGEHGGRRTKAICQFHDVLPTILEAVGLGASNDAFQGRSFLPVLKGERDRHRDAAIMGYFARGGKTTDRCIRDGRWSLIERMSGGPDELYDLDTDPKETNNLIDEHPDAARRLASMFGNIFRSAPHTAIKGLQAQYELQAAAE